MKPAGDENCMSDASVLATFCIFAAFLLLLWAITYAPLIITLMDYTDEETLALVGWSLWATLLSAPVGLMSSAFVKIIRLEGRHFICPLICPDKRARLSH